MHQLHAILVPVTSNPASLDAVVTACMVARPRKAKVHALHVIEVLRSLPLNSALDEEARRGQQLLHRAEELATECDWHVTPELVQAREAGQAIVDEARDRAVDAIVMGIGHKRVIGEFQVGRTADYVLRHAECQVWVVRQPFAAVPGHNGRD